jgi:hypothetical protein
MLFGTHAKRRNKSICIQVSRTLASAPSSSRADILSWLENKPPAAGAVSRAPHMANSPMTSITVLSSWSRSNG